MFCHFSFKAYYEEGGYVMMANVYVYIPQKLGLCYFMIAKLCTSITCSTHTHIWYICRYYTQSQMEQGYIHMYVFCLKWSGSAGTVGCSKKQDIFNLNVCCLCIKM